MRILIIKLGSIGDIVHTLPSLAAIRNGLSDVHVSWVVESRSADILRGNPFIDRLIEIDTKGLRKGNSADETLRALREQVGAIRRDKFDVSVDFQGLIKSAVVGKLSGAKRRWGFSTKALREPASRLLLTNTVKIPRRTHIIRKNLLLAETAFGLSQTTSIEFPINVSPSDADAAAAIIDRAGQRFAILNPGGGWPTKLWDAGRYAKLADRLWIEQRISSVVVTGPNEVDLAHRTLDAVKDAKVVAAQPSLKALFELSRHAAVYIGGDTGPTHVAAAAGAPLVGIFGPTEWWRNGSLDPRDICVERTDIGCRANCHRRSCSNWICMDIDVVDVLAAIRQRISETAATV